MNNAIDLDRARSALFAIPPDLVREEWVKVGMAAKAAGLDFDTFDWWSSNADNYDAKDARTTWNSIDPDGGITAGTLFWMAEQYGWKDDGTPFLPDVSKLLAKFDESSKEPPLQRPKEDPEAVWNRCLPATSHPYIEAKQGLADGLRVVPEDDNLIIAGHSVAGWLVVPAYAPGGSLQSLQFIPSPGAGKKLNLPGASMTNASFTVGTRAPGGVVYVVEGIGQAWACHKATGHPAVVAFGSGNMAKVAASLRAQDPEARLVIVPDRGQEVAAERIAVNLDAVVAPMPQKEEKNFDANDFALRESFEALKDLLIKAEEPYYKLLFDDDIEALPDLEWRVYEVLPAQGMAQIFGPSRAGKSFLSFDMAMAIAEGRDWFGHPVEPAPVVYVMLEGQGALKQRVRAWKLHNGRKLLPPGMAFITQQFGINNHKNIKDLANVVPKGAVVFIDTQNCSAPEADENSSKDMGGIIEGARTLYRMIEGMVVLVAHTGKDISKGPRGHSSQIPAMDAAIEVTRNGDARTWRVDKLKDGADGAEHGFSLKVVELGINKYGKPITSCVVVPDEKSNRHEKLTPSQRQAIEAYCQACEEGNGLLDEAGKFIGLHLEAWRESFYRLSTADSNQAKSKAFQRVRKDLNDKGLLTVNNDVYRITDPATSIKEGRFALAAKTQK